MTTYQVDLEPVGRRVRVNEGETLLDAARAAGVEMVAVCGGEAWCYTCQVRLLEGRLSELTLNEQAGLSDDQIDAGYRLACQASPLSDVRLEIPPESLATQQRLQLEGQEDEVAPAPLVQPVDVRVELATLEDLRSDVTRLQEATAAQGAGRPDFPYAVLRSLSPDLRGQDWAGRLAVRRADGRGEVLALVPGGAPLLGLAVDIGTTKIAAYLVDLASGRALAKAGVVNPQIPYGEDVLSRISYVNEHPDGRQVLQSRLADSLNGLLETLCAEAGAARRQVVDAVVVGNTAIHHLFAGLPVEQLGHAPYVAAIDDPLDVRASDLGLDIAPGAYVHLPANIAGYVGADHVAMSLSSGIWETGRTLLAVDIGTNTEVSLAHGGRIWSCSCASGPAFEGAHIRDGMRAAPGAIERVQILDGVPHLKTIGDQPPVGICGSGIMDAIGELIKTGIINRKGVFDEKRPGVGKEDGVVHFVLAPAAASGNGRPVVVTRRDINEIQLAKAAIRVGVEVLLMEAGITSNDIEEFLIAGAFGTYLDIASTVRTGMFPPLPLERFKQIGNAAGAGARQMLVSAERRTFAAKRARDVQYVELTVHPGFAQQYMKALYF